MISPWTKANTGGYRYGRLQQPGDSPMPAEAVGRPIPEPQWMTRPARTLMAGDEIRHDGARTLVLDAFPDLRPVGPYGELGRVMVLVVEGAELTMGYEQPVLSRDAEEQAAAGGAA